MIQRILKAICSKLAAPAPKWADQTWEEFLKDTPLPKQEMEKNEKEKNAKKEERPPRLNNEECKSRE